jgi:phosphopantetheinyl transferase
MAFARAIFKKCWPRWQHHFAPEARLSLGGVELSALVGSPDRQLSETAGRCLNAGELDQWAELRQKKRRAEWLGGRMAAKWAAAGLLGETAAAWPGLAVLTEENGRPYLPARAGEAPPFISISHSGPLAAALAANLPCGLDIQQPEAKIHTVRQRFVGPEEDPLLNALLPESFTETERLTMLWAAKEAVRKMVRSSPLLGLREIRLLEGNGGHGTPENPLALTFASTGRRDAIPPSGTVLCFFADNLAWAMSCSPVTTKRQ